MLLQASCADTHAWRAPNKSRLPMQVYHGRAVESRLLFRTWFHTAFVSAGAFLLRSWELDKVTCCLTLSVIERYPSAAWHVKILSAGSPLRLLLQGNSSVPRAAALRLQLGEAGNLNAHGSTTSLLGAGSLGRVSAEATLSHAESCNAGVQPPPPYALDIRHIFRR